MHHGTDVSISRVPYLELGAAVGGFAGSGGRRLIAKCLLKTAVLNVLSYKIDARDVRKSVGCPNMLNISTEM